jgi:hypothetical protein
MQHTERFEFDAGSPGDCRAYAELPYTPSGNTSLPCLLGWLRNNGRKGKTQVMVLSACGESLAAQLLRKVCGATTDRVTQSSERIYCAHAQWDLQLLYVLVAHHDSCFGLNFRSANPWL